MTSRHLVFALIVGAGLLAGCGSGEPTDPYAELITDQSRSDEQVMKQMADRIRKIGGFDSRSQLATVTTDAQGRPSITVRFNPDISDSSSQIVVGDGGEWSPVKQRRRDTTSLGVVLMMSDFADLLRVGAARNLQQVEFVFVKTIGTDKGDQKLDVFRALLPREKIVELAALPRDEFGSVDLDVSEHWTVDFDHYAELEFSSAK